MIVRIQIRGKGLLIVIKGDVINGGVKPAANLSETNQRSIGVQQTRMWVF